MLRRKVKWSISVGFQEWRAPYSSDISGEWLVYFCVLSLAWRNKLEKRKWENQIDDLLAFLLFHLQKALLIWKQPPSGTNGELFHILLGTSYGVHCSLLDLCICLINICWVSIRFSTTPSIYLDRANVHFPGNQPIIGIKIISVRRLCVTINAFPACGHKRFPNFLAVCSLLLAAFKTAQESVGRLNPYFSG